MKASNRKGDTVREHNPEANTGEKQQPPGLLEALPFAGYARRQAHAVEAKVLGLLKRRLDALDPPACSGNAAPAAPAPQPEASADLRDPGVIFARLLERSLDQRDDTAERDLLLRIVDQLTCDEVRIVAALSDGHVAPACQVGAASRLGLAALPVLRCASRVGVEAGVMLRAQVPVYLAHLLSLGVIEEVPEDREQGDAYAVLMSEEVVRETTQYIERTLRLQVRVSRFGLRLSALGDNLWACASAAQS